MVLTLKIGDRVKGEIKSKGDKVPIGTIDSVNQLHSSNPSPPFKKGGSATYPKLMGMRG